MFFVLLAVVYAKHALLAMRQENGLMFNIDHRVICEVCLLDLLVATLLIVRLNGHHFTLVQFFHGLKAKIMHYCWRVSDFALFRL